MPLRIAAKVDKADQTYWDDVIKPLVDTHPHVEFVGEIDEHDKAEFLGNAAALLFPVDWPEPFGLVMIEAMACGTPVIAFGRGSVPEVIEDGISGFIVDSVEEAARAVRDIEKLSRGEVRRCFERRFTVERMAADYLDIYRSLPGVQRESGYLRKAAANRMHPALTGSRLAAANLSVATGKVAPLHDAV